MNINKEIEMIINNGKERGLTDEEIISEAKKQNDILGNIIACAISMRNNHPNGIHIEDGFGKWEEVN